MAHSQFGLVGFFDSQKLDHKGKKGHHRYLILRTTVLFMYRAISSESEKAGSSLMLFLSPSDFDTLLVKLSRVLK